MWAYLPYSPKVLSNRYEHRPQDTAVSEFNREMKVLIDRLKLKLGVRGEDLKEKLESLMLYTGTIRATPSMSHLSIPFSHPYIHSSIYTYIHTSIRTYIHTSIHLSIHLYIHTYIHTYIPFSHPYIHPSIHVYIHPSIYLSIHPYINSSIPYIQTYITS
jgi:hypothetical protein